MRGAVAAYAAVVLLVLAGTGLLTHAIAAAERRRLGDEVLRQALWRLDARAGALLLSTAVGSAERGWAARAGEPVSAYLEVDPDGLVVSASGAWPGDGLPRALAALAGGLDQPGPAPDAAALEDAIQSFFPAQEAANAYGARAGSALRLRQAGQALARIPGGPVSARWADGQLVLARVALRDGRRHVQAAVMDWPRLRDELAASVRDLLPQARLEPVPLSRAEPDHLAALPVRLRPGAIAVALPAGLSALLAAAWACVLLGLAGGGAALAAALRLAGRRAAFVSAVTHELRTPLTALRLHADLIADERIGGDPGRRAGAAQVLRGEAARLARLVDNVLDYARLEHRRAPRLQAHALPALIEAARPAAAARLAEAGLALELGAIPAAAARCDADAVARILANLVDNAAKYGRGPVSIGARVDGERVRIAVRDRGPGIAADVAPRLFAPFARSAEAAAGSAPGVGLGLALCRRLARAQGGELRLTAADDGPGLRAELELRLAR